MTPAAERNSPTLRRRVRPGDAAAVADLVRATGFFTPEEVAVARELVETTLTQGEGAGYRFLFADEGGALAGYACHGPIPATEGRYDLYWIAVHPERQGRGLGARLLAAAEADVAAAGGTRVYIETSSRPGYEGTRRFYLAAGYRLEARLSDFYRPGDDKVIYAKDLA